MISNYYLKQIKINLDEDDDNMKIICVKRTNKKRSTTYGTEGKEIQFFVDENLRNANGCYWKKVDESDGNFINKFELYYATDTLVETQKEKMIKTQTDKKLLSPSNEPCKGITLKFESFGEEKVYGIPCPTDTPMTRSTASIDSRGYFNGGCFRCEYASSNLRGNLKVG